MKNTTTEIKTMSKREVTNLFKKICDQVIFLKNVSEVEALVNNLVPNATDLDFEILENGDFNSSFMITANYTGKHTKSEFKKMDENFSTLVEMSIISFGINKSGGEYEIEAYAWVTFENEFGYEESRDLLLKRGVVKIPLNLRVGEKEAILADIRGLASGTIATLLSKEKVGEASSLYTLIDEVQIRFANYIDTYIETTSNIPSDVDEAWNIFKSNISVKDIAYEIGISEDKVEPYYEVSNYCNIELQKLVNMFKNILTKDNVNSSELSDEDLKNLTYAHSLSVLKKHCELCNESGINKVKNESIPKLLSGGFEKEFYLNYGERGLSKLRELK